MRWEMLVFPGLLDELKFFLGDVVPIKKHVDHSVVQFEPLFYLVLDEIWIEEFSSLVVFVVNFYIPSVTNHFFCDSLVVRAQPVAFLATTSDHPLLGVSVYQVLQ